MHERGKKVAHQCLWVIATNTQIFHVTRVSSFPSSCGISSVSSITHIRSTAAFDYPWEKSKTCYHPHSYMRLVPRSDSLVLMSCIHLSVVVSLHGTIKKVIVHCQNADFILLPVEMWQVWFHISQEFKICGFSESVKTHQMAPFTLQFHYLSSFKSPVRGVLSRHADCSNLCNTPHEFEVDSFSKPWKWEVKSEQWDARTDRGL